MEEPTFTRLSLQLEEDCSHSHDCYPMPLTQAPKTVVLSISQLLSLQRIENWGTPPFQCSGGGSSCASISRAVIDHTYPVYTNTTLDSYFPYRLCRSSIESHQEALSQPITSRSIKMTLQFEKSSLSKMNELFHSLHRVYGTSYPLRVFLSNIT